MLLLYPYAQNAAYHSRTQATRDTLTALLPAWQDQGHRVLPWPVGTDSRYEQGIYFHWGQDDLIILEHDVVPTWGHFMQLAACPYPLCTVAYPLNQPQPDGSYHGELVQREQMPDGSRRWLPYGQTWADYTGLGFVRLRREWMQAHSPGWDPGRWSDLDARISWWTYRLGFRWHVHYPVCRHSHYGEGYVPA